MIRKSLYGFFIQNGKESIPVRIDRYPFGEWLNIYLQTLFAEKPEISEIWMNPTVDKSEKTRIIEETTEYYFLSLFASWFDVPHSHQKNWKIFNRKDISQLLSFNRFLDLFTQPMEERPIFANEHRKENVLTYFAMNDSGKLLGFYEDFRLVLPTGSSIKKQNNWLIFDTPIYKLRFRSSCEGYSSSLPIDFAKYYLGFSKKAAKNVQVQIEITRKLNSCLFPNHRTLYKEMMEFIEYFEESISYQKFFAKQNWEAICIQSRMIENLTINGLAGNKLYGVNPR